MTVYSFILLFWSGEATFYKGRVFGEVKSHVNAQLEDGLLTASIVTKEDSYHVEVLYSSAISYF